MIAHASGSERRLSVGCVEVAMHWLPRGRVQSEEGVIIAASVVPGFEFSRSEEMVSKPPFPGGFADYFRTFYGPPPI